MTRIVLPTQAELDAIDPAELAAGLKELHIGERVMGIRFREEAGEKLWAAFCERWKLRRPDKRTHRGGTRKYLLANVRVASAEIGVSQHTVEKALRTGRVTMWLIEGMLVMRFDEWSAMALGDQLAAFEERLAWWKAYPAPALGHGQRGKYEKGLREWWAKRRKGNAELGTRNAERGQEEGDRETGRQGDAGEKKTRGIGDAGKKKGGKT